MLDLSTKRKKEREERKNGSMEKRKYNPTEE